MTIGSWASVAAGAVVTRDVADFAVVAGVPAKRVGWVGKAGLPLRPVDGVWVCPHTSSRYEEHDGVLRESGDYGTHLRSGGSGARAGLDGVDGVSGRLEQQTMQSVELPIT